MAEPFLVEGHVEVCQHAEGGRDVRSAAHRAGPKKRAALEQALEKYWTDEECGWIVLYDQQDVYGVSKRIHWKARPDELMKFDEATVSR